MKQTYTRIQTSERISSKYHSIRLLAYIEPNNIRIIHV